MLVTGGFNDTLACRDLTAEEVGKTWESGASVKDFSAPLRFCSRQLRTIPSQPFALRQACPQIVSNCGIDILFDRREKSDLTPHPAMFCRCRSTCCLKVFQQITGGSASKRHRRIETFDQGTKTKTNDLVEQKPIETYKIEGVTFCSMWTSLAAFSCLKGTVCRFQSFSTCPCQFMPPPSPFLQCEVFESCCSHTVYKWGWFDMILRSCHIRIC